MCSLGHQILRKRWWCSTLVPIGSPLWPMDLTRHMYLRVPPHLNLSNHLNKLNNTVPQLCGASCFKTQFVLLVIIKVIKGVSMISNSSQSQRLKDLMKVFKASWVWGHLTTDLHLFSKNCMTAERLRNH